MTARRALVEPNGPLSMRGQCELLGVNRSSLYYEAVDTQMELAIVPALWCSAQLAGVDSETAAVDQDVQRRLLLVLVEGDLTQLRLAPRDRGVIGHIIV